MVEPRSGSATDGLATMRRWCLELPEQLERALAQARAQEWPPQEWRDSTGPVFLGGMGGSASACRLAHAALASSLGAPCVVQSDPSLPSWLGPSSRVVISSYSGESWEAVEMLAHARAAGAEPLVIAQGGELIAESGLSPARAFVVPGGYAPRAALGWMVVPVLRALGWEKAPRIERELESAAQAIRREMALWERSDALCRERDPQVLAEALRGRRIFLYALGESDRALTGRWKNVLNENAKRLAHEAYLPELVHAEIVGWAEPPAAVPATVLILGNPGLDSGKRARVAAAAEREISARGAQVIRVPVHDPRASRAEQLLAHVALGDYTSLVLAERTGIDPMPIDAIARVKAAARSQTERSRG